MSDGKIWRSVSPQYCEENDSIDLVDDDGDVLVRLHRNMVIRMLGMLPGEPPKKGAVE